MTAHWVHWNGTLQPAGTALVPCNDLGFLAGDGVFETVWVTNRTPVFLAAHLARLRRGLEQLQIPLPGSSGAWTAHIRELIAAESQVAASARLRITVTAGAAASGVRRRGPAHVLIAIEPWAAPADSVYARGVQVAVSGHRRAPHPLHAIKSTSYAASLWQRREARDPATFDVVQCNTSDAVAEGSFTNVFTVDGDGVLSTPLPADGCLPGVTRAVVLELARAAGIACREGAVPAAALYAAPELFLTGSLCGIVPVCQVSGRTAPLAGPGPVTRRLMAAYAARVRLECQQESIGAANDG